MRIMMLAQSFAMISNHDDNRVVVPARLFQIADKSSQDGIGIGNLAIVRTIFVGFRKRRRRLVGVVGIIKVQPDKMWARGMDCEPILSVLSHVHGAAFQSSKA